MCYYNRPNLVRFALNSIKQQSFKNWELCFVDDGSKESAINSINEILGDEVRKTKYYNTNHSFMDKKTNGGSFFGFYWTLACQESDANFALMLCDDDALTVDYLENLNNFLKNNLCNWLYSHYLCYNAFNQKKFSEIDYTKCCPDITSEVNPQNVLDASQVVFSTDAFKSKGIEFGYPMTANLDSDIYKKLYPIYGPCVYSGLTGQYKSIESNNLSYRQHDIKRTYLDNIDINYKPF